MNSYHIAVQRWPLPWMSKYRVVAHKWNEDETRLVLHFVGGDSLQFTHMERRKVRVFADHITFQLYAERNARRERGGEYSDPPKPRQAPVGPQSPFAMRAEIEERIIKGASKIADQDEFVPESMPLPPLPDENYEFAQH